MTFSVKQQKVCINLIILILAFPLSSFSLFGSMKAEDNQTLTRNLRALSTDWIQELVGPTNQILWKIEYTRSDWQSFFSQYFAETSFTAELYNYLQYPIFYWGTDGARVELQEGIAKSLQELTNRIIMQHDNELGIALNEDATLLETLRATTRFMNLFAKSKDLSVQTRDELYNFHKSLVDQNQIFQKEYTIDINSFPHLGWLRSQIYMNLVSLPLQNSADPKILRPEIKQQIADTVHLTDKYLDIWNQFSVIIIDNAGLDDRQLSLIYGTLELIPSLLHNLGAITVWDFLGEEDWINAVNTNVINIGSIN